MDNTFHSLEWTHQLRDAEIPPAVKLLGWAMMSYANREGLARPTVDQLRLLTPKNLEEDISAPVSEHHQAPPSQAGRARLDRAGREGPGTWSSERLQALFPGRKTGLESV